MQFMNKTWLFPQSFEEAKAAQKEMAQKVSLEDATDESIIHIAGMDVSNTPFDPAEMIFGAVVVLSYPSLVIEETANQEGIQKFPYIPGLLGFREAPILVEAYDQLSIRPDVLFIDGHGVSHPRGLGIASQLGVLLDIPTIGVAKSILVGTPKEPLPEEAGQMTPLLWKEKEIAMVVRTKKKCSPLIISAGHKMTLRRAVQLVLGCLKGYRLPEPTRHAHLFANACRKMSRPCRVGRGP